MGHDQVVHEDVDFDRRLGVLVDEALAAELLRLLDVGIGKIAPFLEQVADGSLLLPGPIRSMSR
jgi:hypothetical protein